MKSAPVHVKVISPSKAGAHKTLIFFHIKDSTLIQFTLDIEPFMPIYQDNYSPKMVGKTKNQDKCDNYIEFD